MRAPIIVQMKGITHDQYCALVTEVKSKYRTVRIKTIGEGNPPTYEVDVTIECPDNGERQRVLEGLAKIVGTLERT